MCFRMCIQYISQSNSINFLVIYYNRIPELTLFNSVIYVFNKLYCMSLSFLFIIILIPQIIPVM